MNRRERRRGHVNHERWLVSYADFITLLFAFFVVLYSSSKADQRKQYEVSRAIDSAFRALGIFPDPMRRRAELKNLNAAHSDRDIPSLHAVMKEEVAAPSVVRNDLAKVQKVLEEMLASQIEHHTASIYMGEAGLVISLREAGFFDSGSALPHRDAVPLLRQISEVLGKTPYNVRIEGHTDNVPIHNREFDSNWELSVARATRVTRIFLDSRGISPERLAAAGYAENHPVATNDTADGRAQNRRVDLVVMPKTIVNLAYPDGDISKASWRRITE